MSLKINVIYKGIIYRIKGIKVLCSVVWTVIILLSAIIGLGVWMLINVYESSGAMSLSFTEDLKTHNSLNESYGTEKEEAPFIDFGKSDNSKPPEIFDMKIKDARLIEATTERTLSTKLSKIKIDPPKSTTEFTSGADYEDYETVYEYEYEPYESEEVIETKDDPHITKTDFKPSERIIKTAPPILPIVNSDDEPFKVQLDGGFIPVDISAKSGNTNIQSKSTEVSDVYEEYSPFHELKYPTERRPEISRRIPVNDWKPKKEVRPTYVRTPLPRTPLTTNQFTRRIGIPATKDLIYRGPPVVGYGSNPYVKLTRDRIREYEEFWETYAGKKANFIFKVNETKRINMRPHLRGLRPTGSEYDLPIRPDAQVPEIDIRRRRPSKGSPIPRVVNPIRKMMFISSTTEKPIVHALNPLQELYDYSKKLAASLLSFNTKSADEIQDSTQKLAEYGINLIDNHNQLFKNFSKGPLDKLVSLIPSAERLRAMDPFELSLITWTFLDFWEFLIEKVGTLSDEDLVLLQERIEALRKRKDSAMTRVFVNETLTRYSPGKQRRIPKAGENVEGIFNAENEKNESVNSHVLHNIPTKDEPTLFNSLSNIKNQDFAETQSTVAPTTTSETSVGVQNAELISNLYEKRFSVEDLNKNTQRKNSKILSNETKVSSENGKNILEFGLSDENNPDSTTEGITLLSNTSATKKANNSKDAEYIGVEKDPNLFQHTILQLISYLSPAQYERSPETISDNYPPYSVEGRSSNWNPLGLFTSENRIQFMQFAVKVLFNFGKVYIKKPYALDCTMLLFCKDLNRASGKNGIEAVAAKLKSVGLKVLTESDKQLRETDTFGEVWRSVTAWTPLQCNVMFPRCNGPKALEIVNEVALGGN